MIRFALITATLAATFSLPTSAFASSLSDPPTTRLVQGTVFSINHATPKCAGENSCPSHTKIEIDFVLGCLNDVVVTSGANVDEAAETIALSVAAVEQINPQSASARCVRANKKRATIYVQSFIRQLDLSKVTVKFHDATSETVDAL